MKIYSCFIEVNTYTGCPIHKPNIISESSYDGLNINFIRLRRVHNDKVLNFAPYQHKVNRMSK